MDAQLLRLYILVVLLAVLGGGRGDDRGILMAFKSSADVANQLTNWGNGEPCTANWTCVVCHQNRVQRLTLNDMHLAGSFQHLTELDTLRILSLKGNDFSGTLPTNLTSWRNMWALYLHHNNLSGEIPPSFSSLVHLWRLNLSYNNFVGDVPTFLASSPRLITLRLEHNRFNGSIPDFGLVNLTDFSVADNQLSGEIPPSLQNFTSSSFLGNPFLCGGPLAACTPTPAPAETPEGTVPATPTSKPNETSGKKSGSKLGTGAIIAIVVGDAAVLALIATVFLVYYWKRHQKLYQTSPKNIDEKGDFSVSHYAAQVPEAERSKLVFIDSKAVGFDLEDLLRASAEMLGKGSFGTAYKAVLEDGTIVAVKRLKDITTGSKKEFDQHMELIGKVRHANVVQLKAYYYAKEEKLLVYDFMPNGNLHTLLHGNRGPGRTSLDWTTRVKIALGAAKGLAFIHRQSAQKIPHGNIRSSNVLLDKDGNACIADYGLALLMNAASASRLVGYRAPEHIESKKISLKGDVYSFGVLLLEILTGKAPAQSSVQGENIDLPRWVQSVIREEWTAEVFDIELMKYKNIEEEMVAMLQIGMLCVSQSPDERPKMSQVVKMIEDIRADQSPAADDSTGTQSRSGSPSDASH